MYPNNNNNKNYNLHNTKDNSSMPECTFFDLLFGCLNCIINYNIFIGFDNFYNILKTLKMTITL